MSANNSDFLNSLLDKIDNNKNDKIRESETNSIHNSKIQKLNHLEDEHLNWKKYYDNCSGKFYYHNHVTNITTWDKPDSFEDPITSIFSCDLNMSQNNLQEDYKAIAYFNKGAGHMSTDSTYWEKVILSIILHI